MRLAAALVALVVPLAAAAADRAILSAEFAEPTDIYPHGALGDPLEWGAMILEEGYATGETGGLFSGSATLTWRLSLEDHVYEDTAPRMWDVTGDGLPEVVVVQSHVEKGARLSIYGLEDGELWRVSTGYVGERFRWLAPVAAADLDGDGRIEIAMIDRPHLARTLMLMVLEGDRLVPLASVPGLTNHRFGSDTILGGVRSCAGRPELVLAKGDWSALMAVEWDGKVFTGYEIGPDTSPEGFAAAMTCG